MSPNVGNIDRVIRALLGIALITAPLINFMQVWSSSWLSYGTMAVGVILILTAVFSFCPVYRLFGKHDIEV